MLPLAKNFCLLRRHLLNLEPPLGNPGYAPATGTTLLTLKIYSRCLIAILKVKYTELKFSYLTTV